MSRNVRWRVDGRDMTPDGYHDQLLYEGLSWWQAFKAIRAAKRAGMAASVTYRVDSPE